MEPSRVDGVEAPLHFKTRRSHTCRAQVLLAGIYPNIQHKKLKVKDRSWDAAKKQCLGNIKEYIEYLKEIKNQVDASADLSVQMKEVRPLIALEHFNVETIKGKNSAAAGVTGFILNIVIYYDIVVTVGGSEALLFAMAAVTDPGDSVLVCEPYYTNYAGYANMLGIGVDAVTTTPENSYRINPADVEAAITPNTKAMVIPSPGNPTGVVLTSRELEALADICRRHGLFYISDEVYREFVYDEPSGTRAPSILGCAGTEDTAIVIDSVSKRYSACGARIGCLVTRNTELRTAALHYGQARLSPATVDQYAGLAALQTGKGGWELLMRAEGSYEQACHPCTRVVRLRLPRL